MGKESAYIGATADAGSVPRLGRSSGEENSNLLQYSCLKKPMDRGCSWATIQRVTNRDMTEHAGTHTHKQIQTSVTR